MSLKYEPSSEPQLGGVFYKQWAGLLTGRGDGVDRCTPPMHPAPCTLHPAPCTLHPAPPSIGLDGSETSAEGGGVQVPETKQTNLT